MPSSVVARMLTTTLATLGLIAEVIGGLLLSIELLWNVESLKSIALIIAIVFGFIGAAIVLAYATAGALTVFLRWVTGPDPKKTDDRTRRVGQVGFFILILGFCPTTV